MAKIDRAIERDELYEQLYEGLENFELTQSVVHWSFAAQTDLRLDELHVSIVFEVRNDVASVR